jgi:hypothetical protein
MMRHPLEEHEYRGHLMVDLYQEAPLISQPSQLQRLLSALLPGGRHGLLSLSLLSQTAVPLDAFSHDALSSLTALELIMTTQHLLPSLLGQVPHLRQLAGFGFDRIPPCLTPYRGLTKLVLANMYDAAWPEGPYLHSLQELDLSLSSLVPRERFLPAALTSAVNLRHLTIRAFVLRLAEVEEVLLRLPHLQSLTTHGTQLTPAALLRLARGAPQLRIDGVQDTLPASFW